MVAPRAVLRFLGVIVAALFLTALTQIGGVVLLLSLGLGSLLRWRGVKRLSAVTLLFLAVYAVSSVFLVPPLAALGGRGPLPCWGEPLRTLPVLCVLNWHYVSRQLGALADALAVDLDQEFPGSVIVALDANFPFLDGFPLFPHLSHDDGNKLDLSFFYAEESGVYQPGATRSPIGYWAFETPTVQEETSCPPDGLSMRWDLDVLQPLFPNLQLESQRTGFALRWLVSEGPIYGLQRVFIEPYLARRLEISSPLLGFQGCRAARHDDHIHLQIAN